MLFVKTVFVLLHIITAAAWFGMAIFIGSQARLALQLEKSAAVEAAGNGLRFARMMTLFAILTLVFALCAFFTGGGFSALGMPYHMALLLILVLGGVQLGLIQPSFGRLISTIASAGPTSPQAEVIRKRIGMGLGIGHTLWLVLLVLMYWNTLTL